MRPVRTLAALCLLALPLAAAPVAAEEPRPSIVVTGEGRAAAVPDMAEITLGVSVQAKAAADAMREASEVTQRILDRMPGFGIEAVDVQTSDLSLHPVWDQRMQEQGAGPRIAGYEATNRVTVRVRDLAKLGEVLDAVLTDGANRMDGLRFAVADPAPLLERARRRAVEDARARAALYAEAAGVPLGEVLAISEAGGAMPMADMAFEMARSSAVPVAAGETEIAAQVTMRFAIGE